jgi:hypothetical protein
VCLAVSSKDLTKMQVQRPKHNQSRSVVFRSVLIKANHEKAIDRLTHDVLFFKKKLLTVTVTTDCENNTNKDRLTKDFDFL